MLNRKWLWFLGVLLVLSYVLPYTVLSGLNAWYGSFLLWSVVGALVIFANYMLTRDFGGETI